MTAEGFEFRQKAGRRVFDGFGFRSLLRAGPDGVGGDGWAILSGVGAVPDRLEELCPVGH